MTITGQLIVMLKKCLEKEQAKNEGRASFNAWRAKEITDLFQTDKFIETKNDNYEKIEKVAKN